MEKRNVTIIVRHEDGTSRRTTITGEELDLLFDMMDSVLVTQRPGSELDVLVGKLDVLRE